MVVRLDDAGPEAVDEIRAVGDFDEVTMPMEEVVITGARQRVGQGHQRGAAQAPVPRGGIPLGHTHFDISGGSI